MTSAITLRLLLLNSLWLTGFAAITLQTCAQPADHVPGTLEKTVTVRVDTLADDLEVPWSIAFLPNGDLLFTEREGNIRVIRNGKLLEDPISGVPEVQSKGQGGLFDLKLHPQYEQNGWIYMTYAAPGLEGEEGEGTNTALMRAKLDGMTLVNHELLFKATPNYETNHHYGGRIAFDDQGYLFLTVGDRGGQDEAQLLSTYRGKVLRLHDDGRIPTDNPYVDQEGAHPEIYSYGHRNPQGLITRGNQVWAHEHGPRGGDELNLVEPTLNYGWPVISYGINYNGTILTEDTVMEGMEQPVTYWVPSIAPCGMDMVTSDRYGDWKGDFLIGSLKFSYLVRCKMEGDKVLGQEILLQDIGRVRAVTQGPDGYIYLGIEGPGMIIRLMPE